MKIVREQPGSREGIHGNSGAMHGVSLEARLERGYVLIDERLARGEDVSTLEEHWLSLLAEYEATMRGRAEAA